MPAAAGPNGVDPGARSAARWCPLLHAALLAISLAVVLLAGGTDSVWTAGAWSGHDGMQHFRVAADPLPETPITDNPIRYGRILYPLTATTLGWMLSPLFEDTCDIPHLEGRQPGRLLPTAWALWMLPWVFALLAVREAALCLGPRGGVLAALCPLLLLADLHCLPFPILAWGTFRFLRRWHEEAGASRLALLAAALCLVHPSAAILPGAWVAGTWLRPETGWRQRLGVLAAALAALAPLLLWALFLLARPGFATGEGAGEYGRAAFAPLPFAGLVEGVARNISAGTDELSRGEVVDAGARAVRHGLLLGATMAFLISGLLVRRHSRRWSLGAYWVLGSVLLVLVDWQVTCDLDNLGRLLFASPLVYLAILAPRRRHLRRALFVLALLAFLAVDVNYLASFLSKVEAGGVVSEASRSWWFH